jgi:hypothetical protein
MAKEKTHPFTVALTIAVAVVLSLYLFSHTGFYKIGRAHV